MPLTQSGDAPSTIGAGMPLISPKMFNWFCLFQFFSCAVKPASLTVAVSSEDVTLPFATLTTALLLSSETLTWTTPGIFVSATCTFFTQAPHVIPVTLNAISSSADSLGESVLKPAASTAAVSWSTVTCPFATLMTALLSSSETLASITPGIFVSATCTLLTQAPHVMPDTANANCSEVRGTGTNTLTNSPESTSKILTFPSNPPVATCFPSG